MEKTDRVNVVCLKWGSRYPALYVNRLYRGVKAHLKRPFRFVCFTDDASGLVDGIEAAAFPAKPPGWKYDWPNIFVKLCLFKDGMGGLEGPTLFLDIDQIITGDLGRFFDYEPGRFCIIRNWLEWRKRIFRGLPKIGNSSCFRFDAGKMNYAYEQFLAEEDEAPLKTTYRTEQAFMTHAVRLENIAWWPSDWVVSFKRGCMRMFPFNLLWPAKPPKGASILCFHGRPDQDDAIRGYRGKHLNTRVKPCAWVKELWEGAACGAC